MDAEVFDYAEKYLEEISTNVIRIFDAVGGDKNLLSRLDVQNKSDAIRGFLLGILMKELQCKFGQERGVINDSKGEERLEKLCSKIRMSTFE